MTRFTKFVLPVAMLSNSVAACYELVEDLPTATQFFAGFDWLTSPDPTNGHVKFVDMVTANSTGMAGTITTRYGPAIYLGTEHNSVSTEGRKSLRLTSKKTHTHALWITDILHAPSVPGGWPAYWLLGRGEQWPNAGEIDIFEQVNNATKNKMTLHTKAGIRITNDTSPMTDGVNIETLDCDANAANQAKNMACGIVQPSTTFGDAFNENDGGVFATEVISEAIKSWFFPRNKMPPDIDFNDPKSTDGWPKPSALFTSTGVDYDSYFKNLQIIWDITFCGDWAGAVWKSSGFESLAPTCEDYVSNHPEAFRDAYFAIFGHKVFEDIGSDGASCTSAA